MPAGTPGVTVNGTLLRSLRRSRGLTQVTLGRRAGLCSLTIGRMERGGDGQAGFSPTTVDLVADALRVEPVQLIVSTNAACPHCGGPL